MGLPRISGSCRSGFPPATRSIRYAGHAYRYSNVPGDARLEHRPDRVDDGGLRDGENMPDNDPRWRTGKLDLVKREPTWP